jgi:hypothetical protein
MDPQIFIKGRKAYSFEYHEGASQESTGLTVIKVYTVIGERIFIITCHSHDPKSGEVNQYEQYYNDFQHMIKSFTYSGTMEIL